MTKIKGKRYRRVKMKKSGACPLGARKFSRGKSRRTQCFQLVHKNGKR